MIYETKLTAKYVNRPLQFHEGCQLFIGAHNETLSVTMGVSAIQIVRPSHETHEHKGDFKE